MIHWLLSPTVRHAALSRVQCTASLTDDPKLHTSTVALVPPEEVWLPIQQARESLRDKGLYRWPPHMNLLYPFVPEEQFAAAADALAPAAAATPPFELTLDTFGVFGGRHRGVLYLCPGALEELAALCELQSALQSAIPHCDDQQRGGVFTPHMTLAHFPSREAAEVARDALAPSWRPPRFSCEGSVHILRRLGNAGQFERGCTLPLGGGGGQPRLFEPPRRFDAMPAEEASWVREARKDAHRTGGGRGRARARSGGRGRRSRRTPEERAAIQSRTPEQITAIRAERAAKREALEARGLDSGGG
jgi:2'-5' RNA ligase